MKIFRRAAALLILFSMIISLLGCSHNDLTPSQKRINIKVIVKKRNHDYWSVVQMGSEAAGREFNIDVDFDGPTDEKDIDGQIRMVEMAVEDGADALVLAASDYNMLVPAAERAKETGIPVIIIDSGINSRDMDSFVGTDNIDAGKKLGESLVDKVGADCTIAVMSFVKGAASAEQREAGLMETIGSYPGIKVVDTKYCNSDETLAQELTGQIIEQYPQIDAIVCLNAYGSVGTARAIDALGKAGDIMIIGFDSTPEEVSFVEKDVIQSLVIQNPFNMGYLGVKYAYDAVNNMQIPKTVNTGSTVIDKNNMYNPENQKLVFPFND